MFELPAIPRWVIDGGNVFVQRQSVRSAADAAALAGGV
jgi:Flp pilus assembly protein TadG